MTQKVFCDFHHGGLFYAMHLLWEKRLGMELYTMRGREWYEKGYWKVNDQLDTVAQYLEHPEIAMYDPLHAREGKNEYAINMLTFDQFKSMKFDYIVASMDQHELPFVELRDRYQPQAKCIYHLGNWGVWPRWAMPNFLNSTSLRAPPGINAVTWREEFDLVDYHYEPPKPGQDVITTFLHMMNGSHGYGAWLALQALLPEIKFREFGITNRDGVCPEQDISDRMREARFVYHVKFPPDGYGHNVHHAAACGRPLITNINDYHGEIAEALFEDMVTVIDASEGPAETARKVCNVLHAPGKHEAMCKAMHERFKKVVNFDQEENDVRLWLERCK